MVTMEMVQEAWDRFDEIKQMAEQYMFPIIARWDVLFTPYYNDLCKNWNEHHADLLLKSMDGMFQSFDLPTMEEWKTQKGD